MSYYVGRRGSLGISKEASGARGVPVAPTYWIPYTSISFDEKAVIVDSEGAFANIADSYESHVVKKYSEGDVEFDLDDKAIGLILAGVVGAVPSSTGSTNYTHTYSISNTNQHQSLSMVVQDPNVTKNFPLSMIDSFTISVEPEGIAKCTISFRGAKGRDWTAETTDFTSLGNKFIHSMLRFTIEDSEIKVKRIELVINKNVEDFQDLGTATPTDILNKQLQVSGSFELGFNDNTYRNYMLDGTTKSLDLTFTYGANNSLQITIPRCRFANWEPSKGLDDIASEKIEFKGLYDVSSSIAQISTLVLKNQVDAY